MNERYRYGYGEDLPNRDLPFSRHGAMTDQREDEERDHHEAGGDEEESAEVTSRADDPVEERREETAAAGDRVEDGADAALPPSGMGAGPAPASTRTDSVFEVGDEPDEQLARPRAPEAGGLAGTTDQRPGTGPAAGDAGGSGDRSQERSAIALGPPPPPSSPLPADVRPGVGEPPEPPVATQRPEPVAPATSDGRPGTVPTTPDRASLLASIDRDSIRSRFLDIQAGFVDEPRQAVQQAEGFVDELVQRLVEALETERAKLKGAIDDGSTEDLRLALRGYRAFVDRLLGLSL
jgi:hypothetical protein